MRFQEFMGFPAESHQTQTRLEKIGLRDFQPSSFDGCCIILKECFIHLCLGFVKYSLQFYMNSPPWSPPNNKFSTTKTRILKYKPRCVFNPQLFWDLGMRQSRGIKIWFAGTVGWSKTDPKMRGENKIARILETPSLNTKWSAQKKWHHVSFVSWISMFWSDFAIWWGSNNREWSRMRNVFLS